MNIPWRTLLCLAAVLIFGAVRMPLESAFTRQLKEDRLLHEPPDIGMRENLGQMGFVATLGGFRSPVASLFDVRAYLDFSEDRWDDLETNYRIITSLQPYQDYYWEMAGWHLAYNGYAFEENNRDQRLAVKERNKLRFVEKGRDFFNRGVSANPQSDRLHSDLGSLHTAQNPHSRDPDPRKAAHHFLRAFEITGRAPFERAAAYDLADCKDRESWETAYEILKRHYEAGTHARSVLRDLGELEDKLDIPTPLRITK